jgi:nitrite reductase/ring-hydroxylating ferredoxin subunit
MLTRSDSGPQARHSKAEKKTYNSSMSPLRPEQQNLSTQPLARHPVFNRWEIVTEGWYILCKANELAREQVLSRNLAGQRLCVFRDSKGQVHALDGFCPHMGVDLGIGKVVGDRLRCFFHHWEFDGHGQCQHIPIQAEIPRQACLTAYACQEKYGFIWVHPDRQTPTKVLTPPGLVGQELVWRHGQPYTRNCHYHITMINGIDPQHLRTVHNLQLEMEIEIDEAENLITIELSGELPQRTLLEKGVRLLLGSRYSYAMTYADGCLAALTLMKNVRFGRRTWPELHMLFAYQTLEPGKTLVQPIYLTQRRQGLIGTLISAFCLFLVKRAFFALQGEDGKVYDNIRFNTRNLLAIDAPVARYLRYINKLKPSRWSRSSNSDSSSEVPPESLL